jgi:hypothetical protein
MGVCLVGHDNLIDLLCPFVEEVEPAQHEKWRNHPRSKIIESESGRQQDQELVPQ